MNVQQLTATLPESLKSVPTKHFEYFLKEEKIHLEKIEREERKRKERKQRKRMDYFKQYLKELYPPLTKDSTWEKVKGIVRHSEEYQDLEESQRVEVFEKVIQRLKVCLLDLLMCPGKGRTF
jgi:hypothetical protein